MFQFLFITNSLFCHIFASSSFCSSSSYITPCLHFLLFFSFSSHSLTLQCPCFPTYSSSICHSISLVIIFPDDLSLPPAPLSPMLHDKGGLFEYVSGANYFSESVEWTGYAIACWSWPGLVMVAFTIMCVGSRALQHHRLVLCISSMLKSIAASQVGIMHIYHA